MLMIHLYSKTELLRIVANDVGWERRHVATGHDTIEVNKRNTRCHCFA
jgi:hypothetical protein